MAKVTYSDVLDNVLSEHFFTAYEGANAKLMPIDGGQAHSILSAQSLKLLTICVLVLKNGFTILGKSACADPTEFNAQIGRDIARDDAISQIWPLMGYKLKCDLNQE